MSTHQATIRWHRAQHPEDGRTYSRNHSIELNGGQRVTASAAADFKGDPAGADPEQMLVAAVASCHMLFFVAIAEHQGYRVDQYEDKAVGFLEATEGRARAITRVELSPKVTFAGQTVPDAAALKRLHDGAHEKCFIANSIKAKVTVAT